MALQVWLPLNGGTLENRGLNTGVSITNNGATVDANGKTGSCYKFDGSSYISVSYGTGILCNDFSVGAWVNMTTVENDKIIFGFLNGSNQRMYVGIKAGTYNLAFGSTLWGRTTSKSVTANSWSYVVVTIHNNVCKLYVDNQLVESITNSTSFNFNSDFMIGGRSDGYKMKGLINDVRIYDHCLTPFEVKELSRGLVAHYKLDDAGIESTINLIDINKMGSQGGTITKLNEVFYTDVYRDVVTNPSHYNNAGWNIGSNVITFSTVPQKLTISFWKRLQVPYTNSIHGYITFNLSSGSTSDVHWVFDKNNWSTDATTIGKWERVTSTVNVPSNAVSIKSLYVYGDMNTIGTCDYAAFQLEAKDHATPYTQSARNNKVWDCSGYGHDGIALGTFTTDSSSPCYENCTVFNGTNSAINIGRSAMVEDTLTVNIWAYMDDWSQYGQAADTGMRIASCTETGGWNFEPSDGCMRFNVYTRALGYRSPTDSTPLASLTPGWHMWTGIFYGSGKRARLLRDGVQVGSSGWSNSSAIKVAYNSSNSIIIGAEPGASPAPVGNYFNGKMSDFRIYATALSDADIAELYKNTAHVHKDAIIIDRGFVETGTVKVNKTGIIEANTILEYDTNLLYDTNIYTEPDGSKWVRVFHHNNPADDTTLFTQTMDFEHGCYVGENSWFNFNVCKSFDHYEFLVKQTITAGAAETKYRFVQATNPFNSVYADVAPTSTNITRITTSGYSTSTTSGGFYKRIYAAYFVAANSNSGNWYGAAGSWTPYGHRLPGYSNYLVTTGYMDVYLRIDNGYGDVDIARIYSSNNLASSRFIEI